MRGAGWTLASGREGDVKEMDDVKLGASRRVGDATREVALLLKQKTPLPHVTLGLDPRVHHATISL